MIHNLHYLGGVPIRYGAPEYWKVKAATIGRTKPSRAPQPDEKRRKKNDGRPPDTVKELFGHPNMKKNTVKKVKPAPGPEVPNKPDFGVPAYPWSGNSCWLDASLQVLYMAVTRDFYDFQTVCEPLDPDFALGALYSIFKERFDLGYEEENMSAILESQRDALRVFLHKKKIISSLNKPESAVVSPKQSYILFIIGARRSTSCIRCGYLPSFAMKTGQDTLEQVDIF